MSHQHIPDAAGFSGGLLATIATAGTSPTAVVLGIGVGVAVNLLSRAAMAGVKALSEWWQSRRGR